MRRPGITDCPAAGITACAQAVIRLAGAAGRDDAVPGPEIGLGSCAPRVMCTAGGRWPNSAGEHQVRSGAARQIRSLWAVTLPLSG